MSGLLGGVLPWAFSQGDRLKRHVGGLLSDPIGTMEQTAGLLMDKHREHQALQAQAFSDPNRPFRLTNEKALGGMVDQMMAGPLGFAPVGMTAWHGSPYMFDRFDIEKRGSGEGNSVFGHGTYLAESPGVAKSYQRNVSRQREVDGGYLYKVDVPDDMAAKLLDWDKPLSQQPVAQNFQFEVYKDPEAVPSQKWAVRTLMGTTPRTINGFKTKKEAQSWTSGLTGEQLYRSLEPSLGYNTSLRLRELGIPGVRYLDQGSRISGGTSNFVIFPGEEGLLKILERNGQSLP